MEISMKFPRETVDHFLPSFNESSPLWIFLQPFLNLENVELFAAVVQYSKSRIWVNIICFSLFVRHLEIFAFELVLLSDFCDVLLV